MSTTIELENEVISGIGTVTGEVEWYPGFRGSLEDPPEPPEILEIYLVDENGDKVDAEAIFEDEGLLKALEDRVLDIMQELDRMYGDE